MLCKGRNLQTATEAHNEIHKQPLEQNSLSEYCQVSSRSPTMAFYDTQNFSQEFPRKHSYASHIGKSYSSWSRAHLTVSTEWVLFETNKSCLCKSMSSFTMVPYGSLNDYIIHIALIATSCVSPITSFQAAAYRSYHDKVTQPLSYRTSFATNNKDVLNWVHFKMFSVSNLLY